MRSHLTIVILLVLMFFGSTPEAGKREPASERQKHEVSYRWGHGRFCYRHAGPRAMIMRVEDRFCGRDYYRRNERTGRCELLAGSGRFRAQVPARHCR